MSSLSSINVALPQIQQQVTFTALLPLLFISIFVSYLGKRNVRPKNDSSVPSIPAAFRPEP